MQRFLKTLSFWYSLDNSGLVIQVLSDEYQCARVIVILKSGLLHHFVLSKLATSSIRVNPYAGGGLFSQYKHKTCKNPEKRLKPWHIGTHLRVLLQGYPMNTNTTGLRWSSQIFAFMHVHWTKVALALEGLTHTDCACSTHCCSNGRSVSPKMRAIFTII